MRMPCQPCLVSTHPPTHLHARVEAGVLLRVDAPARVAVATLRSSSEAARREGTLWERRQRCNFGAHAINDKCSRAMRNLRPPNQQHGPHSAHTFKAVMSRLPPSTRTLSTLSVYDCTAVAMVAARSDRAARGGAQSKASRLGVGAPAHSTRCPRQQRPPSPPTCSSLLPHPQSPFPRSKLHLFLSSCVPSKSSHQMALAPAGTQSGFPSGTGSGPAAGGRGGGLSYTVGAWAARAHAGGGAPSPLQLAACLAAAPDVTHPCCRRRRCRRRRRRRCQGRLGRAAGAARGCSRCGCASQPPW